MQQASAGSHKANLPKSTHTSFFLQSHAVRTLLPQRAPWRGRQPMHGIPGRSVSPLAALPESGIRKGTSLLEWTNKILPQGQLVNGVRQGWRLAWLAMMQELAPQTAKGQYSRPQYAFNGHIGDAQFPSESGRYHLYLGNACPWCHRVALAAVLRGHLVAPTATVLPQQQRRQLPQRPQPLQHVTLTRLEDNPTRARRGGWVFTAADPDPVFRAVDLWEVYDTCQPGFRGRCTAPLMVDRVRRVEVCNESAEIVRSLDEMHLLGCTDVQLRPKHLAAQIDELNAKIYSAINNGVYSSGFATTQEAYETVQAEFWSALDEMEARLKSSRFLLGERLTESDVWLFPTIVRLDAVYGPLFKCCRRRIFGAASPSGAVSGGGGGFGGAGDYPALAAWARDIWQIKVPGSRLQISDTLDLDAARSSYFRNLFPLNPGGIVAAGPTAADLRLQDLPAGRGSTALQDMCYPRDSG
ncbi:hypothetical protein VaNZ11_009657 [Volvox africanus]|uniref:GST C-terminal domain-containing protein n=1 Tax=Volvox africanus TaxID=51714 RepID=A0ABQ5S7Z6_9CHLO|nr:hypothetical protein VaNZ11_009657 [Volvox africanus]